MGKIKMTKIREFIAAISALILIVVLVAFIAAVSGKRIPFLVLITDFFGVGG